MKYLKNWKVVLLISLLLVNSILFYVLFAENLKLPSEEWSRGFVTEKFEATDSVVYNVIYPKVYTTNYEENIINSFYSNGEVTIKILDSQLNELEKFKFDVDLSDISKFVGFNKNDELILYLSSQDGKKVNQLIINLNTYELTKNNLYENEIRSSSFYNNYALFIKNNELILWDGENTEIVLKDKKIEIASIYENNGSLSILAIESLMGNERKLKKYIIDENKIKFITDISELENGANLSVEQIDILISEDNIKILTKIRQEKFNQNFINIFNFDDINNKIILQNKFYNLMSMTNSKLIDSSKNEIKFIQSELITLGMRDISTKDNKYYNLFLDTYTEEGLIDKKLLTKTDHLSSHPNYFKLGEFDYLQWSEIEKEKSNILFSSNNPVLIEKSQHLINDELINLLWAVFSSNMLMINFFLFISLIIILPTIFTVIPISIIFFNWAEKNHDKLFLIAIIIHIFSKLYYVHGYIKDYGDVIDRLPGILSNELFQYSMAMSTTLIGYYCLTDYLKKKKTKNFLHKYLFFFGIDILLLVLILLPYRML
ncbi:MAG: hypothetical protein U9Q80_00825 [Bacillota bacterium]|nr:hypothetical protein [Bacillota bacterium]